MDGGRLSQHNRPYIVFVTSCLAEGSYVMYFYKHASLDQHMEVGVKWQFF